MNRVIVIGCGASGMMAAIAAAREGAQVTVLESGRKPGRKLLLTGNSRCNLTNLDPEIGSRYMSVGEAVTTSGSGSECRPFVSKVMRQFSAEDTLRLFEECGLLTMTEHGTWVYPVTGKSDSVLRILMRELERLQVKMKFNTEVTGIDREGDEWLVRTEGWSYRCDRVVLSCGSRAVPSTGSNGSGYGLCRGLGLDVTDILPALTAVQCRPAWEECRPFRGEGLPQDPEMLRGTEEKNRLSAGYLLSLASGTRVNADVRIYAGDELLAEERGQVQFTQNGISGIVIFNMSRYLVRALREEADVRIRLDLLPLYSEEELVCRLRILSALRPEDPLKELLAGILPPGLIPVIAEEAADIGSAAGMIKSFQLQALGVRDFENCQICAGGLSLQELDPETMQCRRPELNGIHVAGELVDIDGPCGGYNLQWAWSSGYTAGRHAGRLS